MIKEVLLQVHKMYWIFQKVGIENYEGRKLFCKKLFKNTRSLTWSTTICSFLIYLCQGPKLLE